MQNNLPLIKICGLQTMQDVELLRKYQINYAGFIFHKQSSRCLNIETAIPLIELAKKNQIQTIGVFGGQNAKEMQEIMTITSLDFLQLHGDIAKQSIVDLPKDCPKILVIEIDENGNLNKQDLELVQYINKNQDYILFDKPKKSSMKEINIDKIDQLAKFSPYFLAGGLSSKNINQYLDKAKPFAIDICSNIEENNCKSEKSLQEIINKIKVFTL